MPNTQQVGGWWGRMTSAVNSAMTAEQAVGVVPPLKKGGAGGFKDSYQEIGHCEGSVDCLARKLGSSMWLPLAGAFGALKILDAKQRRMYVGSAEEQLKQGEAYLRDGCELDAARLIGAAADTFNALDDPYSEALARERQGDIDIDKHGESNTETQGAYDRSAAIYGRLIDQVSGMEGYEDLKGRLELARAAVLEKALRFDEAAGIYGRLDLPLEHGRALVLGGRYKDALKAFKADEGKTESLGLLLSGTQRMADADRLAKEANKSGTPLKTAPKASIKWQRASEAFYSAALEYHRGRFFELEAVAWDRAIDAARWANATSNMPGSDNRSLQEKFLREKVVALGNAHLFREAADALDEEIGLLDQIGAMRSIKVAKRLKVKMLAKAEKSLERSALTMKELQEAPSRRLLAVRNFVSSFGPEMLGDGSSVRSARQMLADLVAPGRDIERTISSIITGDWRLVEVLDARRFVFLLSPTDWNSLVRIARRLKNAAINDLVGSFSRYDSLNELSLPEKRRLAGEMYEAYGKLNPSARAEWGGPKEGEFLPRKFVGFMVNAFNANRPSVQDERTIEDALEERPLPTREDPVKDDRPPVEEKVESLEDALEGGLPLTDKDISATKPAVVVHDTGRELGGSSPGAKEIEKAVERAEGARAARRLNTEAARRTREK